MVEIFELWAVIVSLILLKLGHWIYRWSNPKCNGKLPPGSMGFPIIGETFQFIKPHDAFQLPTFLTKKVLRHGPVFRTSLFGSKTIISTDAGLNMEVTKMSRIPGIPKSVVRLFGETNVFIHSKESHTHARNLTTKLIGSQGLKLRMMQDINFLARTHMEIGAKNGGLDIQETASQIIMECLAKNVMGDMEPEAAKELALCWRSFPREWFRFSLNIPGSGVYRMMKAKNRMSELIKKMVLKKRASGEKFSEFFKIIFGEKEGEEETMSVEKAADYIFLIFLVANESTPGFIAATVKLIGDNPKVRQELQSEHDRVLRVGLIRRKRPI